MTSQKLAVMLDCRRRAVLLPVLLNGAHAMRADRNDFLDLVLRQCFQVGFGQLLKEQIVAEAPHRIARTLFLAQHAEGAPRCRITRTSASTISRPRRIVRAHAAEPQAVLLRAVEDGQRILLDKFVALRRAHAQRVAAAFERQKELGSVIVLPCAGVDRAAPQADDDGHVLDAHRALELARAAGGALERCLLRVVLAQAAARPTVGPNSFRYPRSPSTISFGFSSFPVLLAGQCSVQRPHSTQE